MNRAIRRVGILMMTLVVLLLANDSYIQGINADGYANNPFNLRRLYDQYSVRRGLVTAADGTVLASSAPTSDKLKYLRTYANGPLYAPVTGYYSVTSGAHGLEYAENEVLNGSDPRLELRRLTDLTSGATAGGDVQLTIDPKVQAAAYDTMVRDGFTGAAVAIQPSTGQILGMVSVPSYDPNKLATHDTAAAQSAYNGYDPQSVTSPLINQAVSQAYAPGSTFKLVVSAAALSAGVDDENTPNLPAAPRITLPGTSTTLENFDGETCPQSVDGQVSMKTALAYSCNTAFATLAGQVGASGLSAQAAKFGFGSSDLTVPLGVVSSCVGPSSGGNCLNIPNGAAGLYQSGIGQLDVQETPLQDAMIAATIANGGKEMRPQLVKALQAPDLSDIEGFTPQTLNSEVISPDVAATLTQMMEASESHSGMAGKNPAITIASKTGTAEHGPDPKNVQPYGWYVAFAPATNPQIAVAVVVTSGGHLDLATVGAQVAGPVGRAMINAAVG
ncbi:penicillin-binding protein 2 [Amycolatopsis acidiphila]|uniref:Penicillin-binding protein 2 n=1 Tax=Amycolatopsis acidiphila TaxID=715473 RepID=A0A557ZYW6_9PSEU|nr:penicillin-binding protein 2 [Amycolatopsis acidiphila]TVT17202.1 penicillin-binding protein 2 [Amycolatopsis acidiphila]UIJ58096.1 penicillin-binding protein 2 [Amycolatopsis acidiphila]